MKENIFKLLQIIPLERDIKLPIIIHHIDKMNIIIHTTMNKIIIIIIKTKE